MLIYWNEESGSEILYFGDNYLLLPEYRHDSNNRKMVQSILVIVTK